MKALESRLQQIEEQLGAMAGRGKKVEAAARMTDAPITAALVDKQFAEADPRIGTDVDRLLLVFDFTNRQKKPLRAFRGLAVLKDLFGKEILVLQVTDEDGMRAGEKVRWPGWIAYHAFDEQHRRLHDIERNDLAVEFLPEQIVYTDGTQETFAIAALVGGQGESATPLRKGVAAPAGTTPTAPTPLAPPQ